MRIGPHQIDTASATAGDALVYDPATDEYGPGSVAGSGVVESVVAGTNVTVDSTDPANPIVSATGGGGGGSTGFTQLRKSADQSIATNTWTAVTWDVEDHDTLAAHDNVTNNSRITAPSTGIMAVNCALAFASGAGNVARYLSFYKNGVQLPGWAAQNEAAIDVLNLHREIPVTSGDYIQVFVYQNATGSLNVLHDVATQVCGAICTARMVGTV